MKPETKHTIIAYITLALSISGGILAVGDKITELPLPGWLVNAWPGFVIAATIVDRIGKIGLARLQGTAAAIILAAFIIPSFSGCDTIRSAANNPTVQFAATQALKIATSYYSNGGNVDSMWGISNGLNLVSDIATYEQQKRAGEIAAKAVKDYAGSKQGVDQFAANIQGLIALTAPSSPKEAEKVIQGIASGVATAAKEASK